MWQEQQTSSCRDSVAAAQHSGNRGQGIVIAQFPVTRRFRQLKLSRL
jgi:hypothetical protein